MTLLVALIACAAATDNSSVLHPANETLVPTNSSSNATVAEAAPDKSSSLKSAALFSVALAPLLLL